MASRTWQLDDGRVVSEVPINAWEVEVNGASVGQIVQTMDDDERVSYVALRTGPEVVGVYSTRDLARGGIISPRRRRASGR